MKSVPTFTATIYIGNFNRDAGEAIPVRKIEEECKAFCDEVGLCVTITPTRFIYTNGAEDGIAIGLINYPRFPSFPEAIKQRALDLAGRLKAAMKQHRVSVVFPGETVMLGD